MQLPHSGHPGASLDRDRSAQPCRAGGYGEGPAEEEHDYFRGGGSQADDEGSAGSDRQIADRRGNGTGQVQGWVDVFRNVAQGSLLVSRRGRGMVTPSKSTVPKGATARCNDGTYYTKAEHQGACSAHKGVAEWLTKGT